MKNLISLLFRKYSSVRLGILLVLIAAALFFISLATAKTKKYPVITSILPAVGSPGDTMVIKGSYFGSSRSSSFVEIGGSRITASGYLSWTDDTIKLVLPSNVQDGLIFVQTQAGRSKPEFFANETGIPVASLETAKTEQPAITSIQPQNCEYGTLVTISGANFGTARGKSQVLFTANRDDAKQRQQNAGDKTGEMELQFIAANPADFDYESWNESEIKVRVPDGTAAGAVIIRTDKGESNSYVLNVSVTPEEKSFTSRKTYIVEVYADIENIISKKGAAVTLRMPKPAVSAGEPFAEMTECSPEPLLADLKNTLVYRIELEKNTKASADKKQFRQKYIISAYDISTNIQAKSVRQFTESGRQLYKTYTAADELIKKDAAVVSLAKKITGTERNPYLKAKLIYSYLLENYTLSKTLRSSTASPYDLAGKVKSGDAYDFAVLYTALLRASDIPAAVMGGVLVNTDLASVPHWWTEFYLEGYGWIPCDVALGMGLPYKSFKTVENPEEYYFGNLDGQHIAFSKGWNELKRSLQEKSKTVCRQKTYALQSIWEESSEGSVNYSSLWIDPVVIGIY